MDDTYIVDWAEQADRLGAAAADEHDWYVSVARTLVRATDRIAVDVGCGGAGMAFALADRLGPEGRVFAVDGSPEILATARDRAAGRRIEFVLADLEAGIAPISSAVGTGADLVWASASVHHVGDQQAAVTALAGLLGPGGRLALAEGGLTPKLLPWDAGLGEPGLETRLYAAQDRWFARMRAQLPGSVPMPYGWTSALSRAGLEGAGTMTSVIERSAPLPSDERERLVERLAHRVERLGPSGLLADADMAVWERLLDPSDEAWLGGRDDLCLLEARSVHVGTHP